MGSALEAQKSARRAWLPQTTSAALIEPLRFRKSFLFIATGIARAHLEIFAIADDGTQILILRTGDAIRAFAVDCTTQANENRVPPNAPAGFIANL